MSAADTTRYPLTWPAGWPRTPARARRTAAFRTGSRVDGVRREQVLSVYQAIVRLTAEFERLGVDTPILSTNVALRLDGQPRSDQREPTDPGAAVYFQMRGAPTCLACDRWRRVADNIAALAAHIDALRRIARYGVGTIDQIFTGYRALPPAETWRAVLGLEGQATRADLERRFLDLVRRHHPDVGGDGDAAQIERLVSARDQGRAELTTQP